MLLAIQGLIYDMYPSSHMQLSFDPGTEGLKGI